MDTTTSIRDFFAVMPPRHRPAFVGTAVEAYDRFGDVDAAIEFALLNTEIAVDLSAEQAAMLDAAFPETLRVAHRELIAAVTEPRTFFDAFADTAELRFALEQETRSAGRAYVTALFEQFPESVPASALGPLFADALVPAPPLLLADEAAGVPPTGGALAEAGFGGGIEIGLWLKDHPKLSALLRVVMETLGAGIIYDFVASEATVVETIALLWAAIKKKERAEIQKLLLKLIRYLMTKKFMAKLIAKLGKKGAAEFLAKLLAREVPVLGWAILIGTLIYELYQHWKEIMDP
jgi:hypothetical protein